jgi:hypothetical protein
MENQKLYEVSKYGDRILHIRAKDSGRAKRAYCKAWGVAASDPWCGASSLSARALKQDEAAAWEAQADTIRATYAFIKGALDICAKAFEERV